MDRAQVISGVSEFMALEGQWNRLADRFPTPLLRHEWFAACLDAFGADCDLTIYTVSNGGRLRAVAPFVVERGGPVPRLVLLGHQTFEPNAILHDDEAALAAVVNAVRESRLPAMLPRLASGSPELACLAAGGMRGLRFVQAHAANATSSAPLASDWPSFEARMSGQRPTSTRQRRKAAEREGPVRFDAFAPAEGEIERHLADLIQVKDAGWKGREGTSLAKDAHMRRFCTVYTAAAARRGILRMFFLRIGDATVVARLAVEYSGRLWELKIAYDERFAKCSPGILLTHKTLRYACERGLTGHKFLGTASNGIAGGRSRFGSTRTCGFIPSRSPAAPRCAWTPAGSPRAAQRGPSARACAGSRETGRRRPRPAKRCVRPCRRCGASPSGNYDRRDWDVAPALVRRHRILPPFLSSISIILGRCAASRHFRSAAIIVSRRVSNRHSAFSTHNIPEAHHIGGSSSTTPRCGLRHSQYARKDSGWGGPPLETRAVLQIHPVWPLPRPRSAA